jgi:hypothetical protein
MWEEPASITVERRPKPWRQARVAYLARRASDYGVQTGHVKVKGKLPYTVIRDGIFAHPTLAESLNNLFMAMDVQGLGEKK